VSAGQTYYYVATAVSTSGVESSYSTQVSATVPTP
jgi:fibronectin type 3 domain-containing protein